MMTTRRPHPWLIDVRCSQRSYVVSLLLGRESWGHFHSRRYHRFRCNQTAALSVKSPSHIFVIMLSAAPSSIALTMRPRTLLTTSSTMDKATPTRVPRPHRAHGSIYSCHASFPGRVRSLGTIRFFESAIDSPDKMPRARTG